MSARALLRWIIVVGLLMGAGALLWLAATAKLAPLLARAFIWLLSAEVLPLAVVVGAAWAAHLLSRSHSIWR